jgi:hypothetical protein
VYASLVRLRHKFSRPFRIAIDRIQPFFVSFRTVVILFSKDAERVGVVHRDLVRPALGGGTMYGTVPSFLHTNGVTIISNPLGPKN